MGGEADPRCPQAIGLAPSELRIGPVPLWSSLNPARSVSVAGERNAALEEPVVRLQVLGDEEDSSGSRGYGGGEAA